MTEQALLDSFLAGTIDLDSFNHEVHVQVTYLLLRERPLPETLIAMRDGLKRLASRAGHPEKYHETIAFAFAAIVNERMQRSGTKEWPAFAAENADLLRWHSDSVLQQFYDPKLLHADEARQTFLLPR